MTPKEYRECLTKLRAEENRPRVALVSNGETITELRLIHRDLGYVELRLSDLVTEESRLPMPFDVFGGICDKIDESASSGEPLLLLGLPGYLDLLTDGPVQTAISKLHDLVDTTHGREAVCLLLSNDNVAPKIRESFCNPRYEQRGQLITIETATAESQQTKSDKADVIVVGKALESLIPEGCLTFQTYLRLVENDPNAKGSQSIVVSSEKPLAGLNARITQLTRLREFAREIHGVEAPWLSEESLRWMCEIAKDKGKTLQDALREKFFPKVDIKTHVLSTFSQRPELELEAALWLVKQCAPKGSYLEYAINQDGVTATNFHQAYITGGAGCLDKTKEYANERCTAIKAAGAEWSETGIRAFIKCCKDESVSHVAPWLNCGTEAERVELLRRCALVGYVSKEVLAVYPELAAYLDPEFDYGEPSLGLYFKEYRELKVHNRITPEFCDKARQSEPPSSVQNRDAMLQEYFADESCALLVADAMGAEWLPMLVARAKKRNIGMEFYAVVKAHLPTETGFNKVIWPDERRKETKRLDNIAHDGAERHESMSDEENLANALDVVDTKVLRRVVDGLTRFERVIVTADHGSSRLAVVAWQTDGKMPVQKLICGEGAEIANLRYCEKPSKGKCPPEMEEALDGKHWAVRGYDRLPKGCGYNGFEMHGGATLEERLVPFVVFSKKGHYAPKPKTEEKNALIDHDHDFDI